MCGTAASKSNVVREIKMQSILEKRTDVQLLNTRQVCAKMGICRKTLHDLEKSGEFPPAIYIRNRLKRWSESTLNNWIAAKESA